MPRKKPAPKNHNPELLPHMPFPVWLEYFVLPWTWEMMQNEIYHLMNARTEIALDAYARSLRRVHHARAAK